MKKLLIVMATILLVLGISGTVTALTNGGFETGDLTGWTTVLPGGSTAQVVSSYSFTDSGGDTATYSPKEGSYFLEIRAQTSGTSPGYVYQQVILNEGDKISGWAAFDSNDSVRSQYNDAASVTIFSGFPLEGAAIEEQSWTAVVDYKFPIQPYVKEMTFVGAYNHTDWMYWEWTAPADGTYYVQLLAIDASFSHDQISHAVFDGIHITVACNVHWSDPEFPPDCMTWFVVQDRKYENGDQHTRVMIEYMDNLPSSPIETVELYDKNGDQVTAVTAINARYGQQSSAFGNFAWCGRSPDEALNWHWDWSQVVDDDWQMYHHFAWELDDYTYVPGWYTIEVTLEDGRAFSKKYQFNEYVDLPIVSLLNEKKKKDAKLDVDFLDDGSMVLRWYPIVMSSQVNTRTHVIMSLARPTYPVDGAYYRDVTQIQPIELGMIVIPPDVLNILQCDDEYDGYIDFQVQNRTTDNNNRAYSNVERFYFDNIPVCP